MLGLFVAFGLALALAVLLVLAVALALVVVLTLESAVELMLATTLAVAVESMATLVSLGVVGVMEYIIDDNDDGDGLSLGVGESDDEPGGDFVAETSGIVVSTKSMSDGVRLGKTGEFDGDTPTGGTPGS